MKLLDGRYSLFLFLSLSPTTAFQSRTNSRFGLIASQRPTSGRIPLVLQADATATSPNAAPVLNGKRVLPYKVIMAGLKGHKVAGVFALLNKGYKRGYAGWEQCEHIGVSMDLDADLTALVEEYGTDNAAHVRALSFVVPSEGAMESVADEWRTDAAKVGGRINFDPVMAAMELPLGHDESYDDDDEDDDEDEDFLEMQAEALSMARGATAAENKSDGGEISSPFDTSTLPQAASTAENEKRSFTRENVDKVLDEVRPYLISDGGNVSVESVDESTRNVYLVLEGACGSCPSSTVTMQMGIERVLKENFEDLGEVLQVVSEDEKPTELTLEAVEAEVNRIKPAIMAMGGAVEIVKVDAAGGTVEIDFRGASKVRQGLELALLDVDFVQDVKFVEE